MARKIAWFLSVALLLLTGVLGSWNAVDEWPGSVTPLQKSVTAGVFLYGIFGLIAAVGMIARRRWSIPAAMAWGVSVTYVASVAAIAFAGKDATVLGAIAAGISSALIASIVVWSARAALPVQRALPDDAQRGAR